MTTPMPLMGYANEFRAAPGESLDFMISCDGHDRYQAEVVRLINGDENPAGPGFKADAVPSPIERDYPGRVQVAHAGSYMVAQARAELDVSDALTVGALIWPTLPGDGAQTILARWSGDQQRGFALKLNESGCLCLEFANGANKRATVAIQTPLESRRWYRVTAGFNCSQGTAFVRQKAVRPLPFSKNDSAAKGTIALPSDFSDGLPVTVAAKGETASTMAEHFNGKIEAPYLYGVSETDAGRLPAPGMEGFDPQASDLFAAWDFSRAIPTARAIDISPNRVHGELINLPARAMTGANWTGDHRDWTRHPDHYGAIHFHDDDLYDAGWSPDFSLTIPDDWRSGIYAVRVSAGEDEDYIPFVVRPPRSTATAPLAVLLPTASYMAYANDHDAFDADAAEILIGRLITLQHQDLAVHYHRELGLCLYDNHRDGSGVCYSTRLRPILNMRPKYSSWLGGAGSGLWQFNADLHLIDWLEQQDIAYDVITDEDLHEEGLAALAPYQAVVTGTHPEYYSTAMLDSLQAYLSHGGRLAYLGGNGFYWRIAFHPTLPGVIEVRRTEDGTRTWMAETGEYHHSFTGEYGGMWRRQARPPQQLVGVGFAAQGFDISSHYRQTEARHDPRAAFIFEGVDADALIGDFGLVGGGAAGLEIDRAEPLLGTPPHALTVASSEGHSDLILLVKEEHALSIPFSTGSQNDDVRADMVFFETESGGAVFSTGSIAWCGSLSHNDYDNNVSRITGNVLKRFVDPEPFAL